VHRACVSWEGRTNPAKRLEDWCAWGEGQLEGQVGNFRSQLLHRPKSFAWILSKRSDDDVIPIWVNCRIQLTRPTSHSQFQPAGKHIVKQHPNLIYIRLRSRKRPSPLFWTHEVIRPQQRPNVSLHTLGLIEVPLGLPDKLKIELSPDNGR